MNRFRLFIAGIVSLMLAFVFSPAHASSGYWVENPNLSVEFHQGNDWGKLDAAHNTLTPRDGECDGNLVRFYLRKDLGGTHAFRYIDDNNGCDTGGGSANIDPYYWDYVMLCEVQDDGDSYCTDKYYLPWGN
jgi:hypothetical protein